MTKHIEQLIKKIHQNGKLLSLQQQDQQNGVKNNFTSCYVEENKMLFRGEFDNPSSSRKALLTMTNMETNEILGKIN